ncbi:MAG: glycoside hydrolase [Actinomycetota bacterium]|nr:glycoside hydrolase [Actinomycetota bacterium]
MRRISLALVVVLVAALVVHFPLTALPHAAAAGRPVSLTLVSNGSDFDERGMSCQSEATRVSWEKESSIAVDPNDPRHVVIAWLEDDAVGIVTSSTFDGGGSWTQAIVPGVTECTGGTAGYVFHPRLYFGTGEDLYLLSHPHQAPFPDPSAANNDVMVNRSDDGGLSWSAPRTITNGPVLTDMDTGAVEPDTGALDVVWSQPEIAQGDPVYVSRSTDGGESWSRSLVRVGRPGTVTFNRILALDGGRLLVFSQDLDAVPLILGPTGLPIGDLSSDVVVSISDDRGKSWSLLPPVVARKVVGEWPAAAVSSDGVVYLATRRATETGFEVSVTKSLDGGETWSEPASAFPFPRGEFDLPQIGLAAGPSGVLGIFYYDYDAAGDPADVRAQLAYSPDGGETWRSSQIGETFDYTTVPDHFTPGGALGLYNEIAARPCGFVVSATLGGILAADGPTDIYFADQRVPGLPQNACHQAPTSSRVDVLK